MPFSNSHFDVRGLAVGMSKRLAWGRGPGHGGIGGVMLDFDAAGNAIRLEVLNVRARSAGRRSRNSRIGDVCGISPRQLYP